MTVAWAGLPVPLVGWPGPVEADVPCGRSIGTDHLLSKTLRPPSAWARGDGRTWTCAEGRTRPHEALHTRGQLNGHEAPSPQLVGPGHCGLVSLEEAT